MYFGSIRELGYELYKVDWQRRISADRQMDLLKDYYDYTLASGEEDYAYEDYLFDNGYNGELYVSFDEFEENEYQDQEYMETLFSKEQYKEYLKDVQGDVQT